MTAGPGRHLLHVGVHKTGSTWLQQCVFPQARAVAYADPVVGALVANLLHADDEDFHADAFRALVADVERRGVRLLISHEGLTGATWADGISGDRLARRLGDVIPHADVIVLIRNQAEMLLALYAQYVNEGGTCALADFLAGDHEGPRLAADVLDYDRVVSAYRDAFGERVWVVPYERVRDDPMQFTRELDDRYDLGLDEPTLRRVNVSLSPTGLRVLRAWNRLFRASPFNPDPAVVSLPGGRRVRNLMQQTIDPPLRRLTPNRAIQHGLELARSHAVAYAQSNVRLAALCDLPLREIGYPWPAD